MEQNKENKKADDSFKTDVNKNKINSKDAKSDNEIDKDKDKQRDEKKKKFKPL